MGPTIPENIADNLIEMEPGTEFILGNQNPFESSGVISQIFKGLSTPADLVNLSQGQDHFPGTFLRRRRTRVRFIGNNKVLRVKEYSQRSRGRNPEPDTLLLRARSVRAGGQTTWFDKDGNVNVRGSHVMSSVFWKRMNKFVTPILLPPRPTALTYIEFTFTKLYTSPPLSLAGQINHINANRFPGRGGIFSPHTILFAGFEFDEVMNSEGVITYPTRLVLHWRIPPPNMRYGGWFYEDLYTGSGAPFEVQEALRDMPAGSRWVPMRSDENKGLTYRDTYSRYSYPSHNIHL